MLLLKPQSLTYGSVTSGVGYLNANIAFHNLTDADLQQSPFDNSGILLSPAQGKSFLIS